MRTSMEYSFLTRPDKQPYQSKHSCYNKSADTKPNNFSNSCFYEKAEDHI